MVVIFHKEDEHCISLRICEVCVLSGACNLSIKKQCVITFVINSIRVKLEEKMKNYKKLSIHPKFLLEAEIGYVI